MKRSEIILMIAQIPLDFLLLLLAGVSAYHFRFTDWAIALKPVLFDLSLSEFVSFVQPAILLWLVIFAFAGLYSANPNKKLGPVLTRVFFACSAGLAGVAVYVMFTQQLFDSRFLLVASWGFAIMYVSLGRIGMRGLKGLLYRLGIGQRRVVLVGTGTIADIFANTFDTRPGLGYDVIKIVPQFLASTENMLDGVYFDEVIFVNPKAEEKETLRALSYCNTRHKTFKYSADLFSTYASNMAVHPIAGVPVVEIKRTRLEGWGRVIKRMFDLIFGIGFIIILSPIMLITALAIVIETGTPVIYKNERAGIRGKRFFTLKFRSMYKEDSTGSQFGEAGKKAEMKEKELIRKQNVKKGPIYKIANDPRVTAVGRCIRRWSIDELPQLFNVIAGDMSLVGPRPHQPREVEKYKDEYPIVFTLKPGISGSAQISGRSDLTFEEEMKLDILYTERWSLLLDLIILIKTPFVLFRRRKAL